MSTNPMDGVTAIILAAGEGKRMRSRRPKVLHPLCGRPLVTYALRSARAVADRLVMVVSPNAEDVVVAAGDDVTAVEQRERLGTGHAVLQAQVACGEAATILVMPSDMPLLTAETRERRSGRHARHRARRGAARVRAHPAPARARDPHRGGARRHRRSEADRRDQ